MRAPRKRSLRQRFPAEYNCWRSIVERARRGTARLSEEFETFEGFFQSLGEMPKPGMTVDRIDPSNPEYGPKLVRWATKREQSENRRNTVFLTYSGEQFPDHRGTTLPLMRWAELTKTNPQTLRRRRSEGWTDTEVIDGFRSQMFKPFAQMSRRELLDYAPWPSDLFDQLETDYQRDYQFYDDRFDFMLRAVIEPNHARLRRHHRKTAYWLHNEEEQEAFLREVPKRLRTVGDWGRRLGASDEAWRNLIQSYRELKAQERSIAKQREEWIEALSRESSRDKNSTTMKKIRNSLLRKHRPQEFPQED